MSSDVDIKKLVELTKGKTGAFIKGVVDLAKTKTGLRIHANPKSETKILMQEFVEAIKESSKGQEEDISQSMIYM